MKGSIQLSAQFLVTLILTLVILGVGFGIFYKVLDKGEDLGNTVDRQTQIRINELLLEGDLAVAPQVVRIQGGETGSAGLGIYNIYEEEKTFSIAIAANDGGPVTASLPTITIPAETKGYALISLDANGVSSGQYTYTIKVTDDDDGNVYTGKTPVMVVRVQ